MVYGAQTAIIFEPDYNHLSKVNNVDIKCELIMFKNETTFLVSFFQNRLNLIDN